MGGASICHTDERRCGGDLIPPGMEAELFPCLGRHEGAGMVTETGLGSRSFAPGDHILGSLVPQRGRCRYCTSGRRFICNGDSSFMGKGSCGAVRSGPAPGALT